MLCYFSKKPLKSSFHCTGHALLIFLSVFQAFQLFWNSFLIVLYAANNCDLLMANLQEERM